MKIAIAGGTGFVGTRLIERLQEDRHEIIIFTRQPQKARLLFPNAEIVGANLQETGAWQEKLAGCDGVVNLAGAPIAERWTTQYKQEILQSRQLSTRNIVAAIQAALPQPKVLINASAIGYYGTSETIVFNENSPSGNDFLAQVCQEWEKEAIKVKEAGVRLVILRIGIVLGRGGALAKMIPPFKLFAGGPIGSGRQWFSWIHREDLVKAIVTGLERSDFEGIFNATAPNPVRMNQLCKTLGEVMNRPSWLPVPELALDLMLGEGAKVVLEGQQVLPKAFVDKGFYFEYPTLKPALGQILAEN
jgi:hypothetical protein